MPDVCDKLTLAFTRCEACDGRGFVRKGEFPDYRFPRCVACGGAGQCYLYKPPKPSELRA